ncbi:MAG: hypothetical protein WCV84_02985 [Patescibacteria group bacterium]
MAKDKSRGATGGGWNKDAQVKFLVALLEVLGSYVGVNISKIPFLSSAMQGLYDAIVAFIGPAGNPASMEQFMNAGAILVPSLLPGIFGSEFAEGTAQGLVRGVFINLKNQAVPTAPDEYKGLIRRSVDEVAKATGFSKKDASGPGAMSVFKAFAELKSLAARDPMYATLVPRYEESLAKIADSLGPKDEPGDTLTVTREKMKKGKEEAAKFYASIGKVQGVTLEVLISVLSLEDPDVRVATLKGVLLPGDAAATQAAKAGMNMLEDMKRELLDPKSKVRVQVKANIEKVNAGLGGIVAIDHAPQPEGWSATVKRMLRWAGFRK